MESPQHADGAEIRSVPGTQPGRDSLLGLYGYLALRTHESLVQTAVLGGGLADRVELAGLAHGQFDRYLAIAGQLRAEGHDPVAALAPYQRPVEDFAAAMRPGDQLEAMVLIHLSTGLRGDLVAAVAARLNPSDAGLLLSGPAEEQVLQVTAGRVAAVLATDTAQADRIRLSARRFAGEAVSQLERVASRDEGLTALISGRPVTSGDDLAMVSALLESLVTASARRAEALRG